MQIFKDKKHFASFLILAIGILCTILFFNYLFPIFLPFLLGWLLSLALLPLVNRLEKMHVPRWIGALLGLLLVFGLFGLFGYFIGRQLKGQVIQLATSFPAYLQQMQTSLTDFWHNVDALLVGMPDVLIEAVQYAQEELFTILFSLVPTGSSGSAIGAVPNILFALVILFFSAYFFAKDKPLIQKSYREHILPLLGDSFVATRAEMSRSLRGYIKTQVILMVYVFVICIVGLSILQSPYALLLSVTIGVVDALPFFGSGFVLWPGALIHFVSGNTSLAIGYLLIYAVVQVLRQVMQPKILGQQIGLHPLLTLFSMYFGYKTMGVFGLIIGPIFAVVMRGYFQIRHATKEQESHLGEDT